MSYNDAITATRIIRRAYPELGQRTLATLIADLRYSSLGRIDSAIVERAGGLEPWATIYGRIRRFDVSPFWVGGAVFVATNGQKYGHTPGFNTCWLAEMDACVGKVYQVEEIDEDMGVLVHVPENNEEYYFPAKCLRHAQHEASPVSV